MIGVAAPAAATVAMTVEGRVPWAHEAMERRSVIS